MQYGRKYRIGSSISRLEKRESEGKKGTPKLCAKWNKRNFIFSALSNENSSMLPR